MELDTKSFKVRALDLSNRKLLLTSEAGIELSFILNPDQIVLLAYQALGEIWSHYDLVPRD